MLQIEYLEKSNEDIDEIIKVVKKYSKKIWE